MAAILVFLFIWWQLYCGADAAINIARNKPTTSSSIYNNFVPSKAVDGDLSTGWPNVFSTESKGTYAWWRVDLLTQVRDAQVVIYFRTDSSRRRNGLNIYTSSSTFTNPSSASWSPPSNVQLCHNITGRSDGRDIDDVYRVTCTGQWRYLIIYTDTDNDDYGPRLDFGEVQVNACASGKYGSSCDRNCGQCSDPICNYDTGHCLSGDCQQGYTGLKCDGCPPGWYGDSCQETCSTRHCLDKSSTCDNVRGACSGEDCEAGYQGADCSRKCDSGKYGLNCASFCNTRKCKNGPSSVCDPETGKCPEGCLDGWTGQDCSVECPPGKYGMSCQSNCGHCNGNCDPVDGFCRTGCLAGYSGPRCSEDLGLSPLVTVLIGAVISAVVILAVVCGIYFLVIRKRRCQPSGDNEDPRIYEDVPDIPMTESEPQIRPEDEGHEYCNAYSSLDPQTQSVEKNDYDVVQKHYANA